MENGTYFIVPSTKSMLKTGKYYLNIYYNCKDEEIKIESLNPNYEFFEILEESENI